tara:strand:- start:591 stop:929 length:339 start_codon:yes stop_codon:yes gene_type:complete
MKNIFISIFFFLLLFFFSNCNFKRFEQKKFFCEKNKLDIELIDILETRSIKKSYITIKGKEYVAKINEISDIEISLILKDIDLKINLENNEISATNNKNIYFLSCEETNFNI